MTLLNCVCHVHRDILIMHHQRVLATACGMHAAYAPDMAANPFHHKLPTPQTYMQELRQHKLTGAAKFA